MVNIDSATISEVFKSVGGQITGITQNILKYLETKGIFASTTTARIISMIITLIIFYLSVVFLQQVKPIIKYLIIAGLIFIAISIGFTFFDGVG